LDVPSEAVRARMVGKFARYSPIQPYSDRLQLEGDMNRSTLLVMAAFAAGCGRTNSRYFGRTTPPRRQRLVMAIVAGPSTLDPGLSWDIYEPYAIRALFEGLTNYHPQTLEPV